MPVLRSLVVAALLAFVAVGAEAQSSVTFKTASLVIDTAQGPKRFSVELALTPKQQERGLMFRNHLASDAGMLFIFPKVQTATFWMKNTLIPLDMLFIAPDGQVADIHADAVPRSEATIASAVPVKAVLEVNAGTAARLGIKPGTVVHYAAFGNAGR